MMALRLHDVEVPPSKKVMDSNTHYYYLDQLDETDLHLTLDLVEKEHLEASRMQSCRSACSLTWKTKWETMECLL
ncbi:hypothetical protein KIN20_025532 [Parelaphostrongylus tenuis]|uniref:Uncharacterized protein n=1 Tax=Parelaphostrongylus tenuis TaxID=148309 RepID=A0AAD5QUG9_PARTN|nr:hypothetical protein KIN20_025532 [Parelaphostrongylus tenuis]